MTTDRDEHGYPLDPNDPNYPPSEIRVGDWFMLFGRGPKRQRIPHLAGRGQGKAIWSVFDYGLDWNYPDSCYPCGPPTALDRIVAAIDELELCDHHVAQMAAYKLRVALDPGAPRDEGPRLAERPLEQSNASRGTQSSVVTEGYPAPSSTRRHP